MGRLKRRTSALKLRLILLFAGCLAIAGCNTTDNSPIGDNAYDQLGPNHPRGL